MAIVDQQQGERDPKVEDRINHAYVKSLSQLSEVVNSPGFRPNARTCKFILGATDSALHLFAAAARQAPLAKLLACMRADGYHELAKFRETFSLLERLLGEEP